MTHDAPQGSGTANATLKDTGLKGLPDGFYGFGSTALAELVKTKQDQLVCSIHGHDHYGAFMDYIRPKSDFTSVPIVNPGSL